MRFFENWYNPGMDMSHEIHQADIKNLDGSFADLILILQSVYDDSDKLWENKKDWLLDDNGDRVYL